MNIKEGFDQGAKQYDAARKQLIPCFDEFYGIALDIIKFPDKAALKVLDLGAGTGLFSYLLAQRYPNAKFVLYDLSEAMLSEAKSRFANSTTEVEYICKDYSAEPLVGKYDLIISALSIHHLTDLEKQALFTKINWSLTEQGLFINADQVFGETIAIENVYRQAWLNQVQERGVSDTALAQALERMQEDKMSTLSQQLTWLQEANFNQVNCWYKNYSFVVYSGAKHKHG